MQCLKRIADANPMKLIIRGRCFSAALVGVTLFTSEGGTLREWSDPQLWCILAMGLVGVLGFIYEERRAWEPIIPLDLFRNRSFPSPV